VSFDVRALRPADREAWSALWAGYLEFYETVLEARVTEATFSRLCSSALGFTGLVATGDDDAAVGFAHVLFHPSTWSATSYCYLEDLFVAPSARGGGAGRSLIEATYAEADRRGCDRVYWLTGRDNTTAQRLYDRLGVVTEDIVYRR
jgi:GNAT superfamily N-acetyltransferase